MKIIKIILVILIVIIFSGPVLDFIELQYAYIKNPDRAQASQYIKPDCIAAAQAIALHKPSRLKHLNCIGDETGDFFYYSMKWECHECFDKLLEVNATAVDGSTVSEALAFPNDPYYLDQLLERHIDLNKSESGGGLPIHAAVASGRIGNVEKLLDAGADINIVQHGETPLDVARLNPYISERLDMEKLLLRHGAKAANDIEDKQLKAR